MGTHILELEGILEGKNLRERMYESLWLWNISLHIITRGVNFFLKNPCAFLCLLLLTFLVTKKNFLLIADYPSLTHFMTYKKMTWAFQIISMWHKKNVTYSKGRQENELPCWALHFLLHQCQPSKPTFLVMYKNKYFSLIALLNFP